MATKYSKIMFRYDGQDVQFLKDTKTPDYITEKIEAEKCFYEVDLLSWLQNQDIQDGDFIDVGANIGNHSIFFSKIMGRTTWSFEPYAAAFQLLNKNLAANDLDTQHCFPFGLSAKNTKANIVLPDNNNIGAAKVDINDASGSVELKRGDEVLADIQKVALIKIDVEGHELDVLRGCTDTIKAYHPLLLVECMNSEEYNKISSFVEPFGYVPCAVFGATPMVIFKYYVNPAEDLGIAVNQVLRKYFDLDARFVTARDLHRKYAKELRSLQNKYKVLQAKNRKIVRYYDEYNAIKNSRSYKVGALLTSPARKIKRRRGINK